MRLWPFGKEKKGASFFTGVEGGTVAAGLPPFTPTLMLTGTEADARRSSSLMAIVNWIMRQGAEPGMFVYRRNADGDWEKDPEHPAQKIIIRPDPESPKVSMSLLMQVFMESLALGGNAYSYKLRNASGQVIGHTAVRCASIKPKKEAGRLSGYQITLSNGRYVTVPPEDIVHIMEGQDPEEPLLGRSRLKEAVAPIVTDKDLGAYILAITKSPAPSVIISPKNGEDGFGKEQAEAIKNSYMMAGSGNRAGGAIVPSIPMSVDKLSYSPDEMMLDRIQAAVDAKLAAIFGLPAMVVGFQVGLNRSTFSNYAEAREAAVEQLLIPLWRLIEEAFTLQLGPDFWGDDLNYKFGFDYGSVRALSADVNDVWERATNGFLAGTLSRADWKRAVGMKPLAEDEGVFSYMLKGTDLQTLMAGVVASKRPHVPG